MLIRQARKGDAGAAMALIKRSIVELCEADHCDEPERLENWLANKIPHTWHRWCDRKGARVMVAERGDALLGAGMVEDEGEILLLYVHPEATGQGVGQAILGSLERIAADRGALMITTQSTQSGLSFYRAQGYFGLPRELETTLAKPILDAPASELPQGQGALSPEAAPPRARNRSEPRSIRPA